MAVRSTAIGSGRLFGFLLSEHSCNGFMLLFECEHRCRSTFLVANTLIRTGIYEQQHGRLQSKPRRMHKWSAAALILGI